MLLLESRDFGAIALVNAIMFMTANGSRSVLVPLLATQTFAISTTVLGAHLLLLHRPSGVFDLIIFCLSSFALLLPPISEH